MSMELELAGEGLVASPAAAGQGDGRGTWLTPVCARCGSKGGQYFRHYGIMRTCCGEFVWALQPKRGGALKLFAHPGFWSTQEGSAEADVRAFKPRGQA